VLPHCLQEKYGRSTSLKGAGCCAAYQHSGLLPDQPSPGVTRLAIGGDSRDDHSHMYAAYNQDGLEVRLTGGLGAPVVNGLSEDGGGFHHFLIVDVPRASSGTPLLVQVVKFRGSPTMDPKVESKENE